MLSITARCLVNITKRSSRCGRGWCRTSGSRAMVAFSSSQNTFTNDWSHALLRTATTTTRTTPFSTIGTPRDDDDDDDDDEDEEVAATAVGAPPPGPLFSPQVDPEFLITREALPEDLQRAVDEHVAAIWHPKSTTKKRHWPRHYRLDGRTTLTKPKKRALRTDFHMSPFVVLAAHRSLIQHSEYHGKKIGLLQQKLLDDSIPFHWFQEVSEQVGNCGHALILPDKKSGRFLIIEELLAILMRPAIAEYLPADHAWSLSSRQVPPPQKLPKTPSQLVQKIVHEKALGEWNVAGKYDLLLWDLTIVPDNRKEKRKKLQQQQEGRTAKTSTTPKNTVTLTTLQVYHLLNLVAPYVSIWWETTLRSIFKTFGEGTKKKRQWTLDVSATGPTSLPSLLVDLLLLSLDEHPKDWKRQRAPAIVEYVRVGPAIGTLFQGTEKVRGKMERQIALELKSTLQFPKKQIDDPGFSLLRKQGKKVARPKTVASKQ